VANIIVRCFIVLSILAGSSFLTRAEPLSPDLSIVFGPESSKRIILFVHGLQSDPSSAWTNKAGVSWPDLVKGDEKLRDFTVAIYRYDTPHFGRASTIAEIANRMLRQIQDKGVFDKYKEIYFISHSMGGLVAKQVLVNLNTPTQIEQLRKVKAVLFISTPAQGATLAEVGSYLTLNPQIANMKPADLNAFLQTLEDQWQNLLRERQSPPFPRSFCAYETKPTYGTMIVSRVYAATMCDQNPFPVDENHADIVKPASKDSAIYDWARARILEASILAQGPRLKFSMWQTGYNYKPGLIVEGIEWKKQYREYDFSVKNTSKTEGITDLRLRYTLPWAVIISKVTSQEGSEGLAIASGQMEPFKGGKGNQITSLHDFWTNVIEINATGMFPEASFSGKLIMITDLQPTEHTLLSVEYRDRSGVAKTSFAQKISLLDAVTGKIKIEPDPLKGTFKEAMMFHFKEPITFPGKHKQEVETVK
jgi:pimeloyl-ACP methyl ester carboxylesterase